MLAISPIIIDILHLFGAVWNKTVEDFHSATCTSQTRDEVPFGAFFLFVSKGFSEAIRLSETGISAEISL